MVLQNSLMTFSLVGRSLAGFQIESKRSNSRDSLMFLLPTPFLSEVICGRD